MAGAMPRVGTAKSQPCAEGNPRRHARRRCCRQIARHQEREAVPPLDLELLETGRVALCRARASSGLPGAACGTRGELAGCPGGRRVAVQRPRAGSVGGRELRLPSSRECMNLAQTWRPRMGRGEHRFCGPIGASTRLSSLRPHWHGEDLNRLNILDGLTPNRDDSPG